MSKIALKQVCRVKGGSGFPEKYQGKTSGNFPFIKVSDMDLPGNHRYIFKANNYVDNDLVRILNLTVFPENTIVFAKVGAAIFLNRQRLIRNNTVIDNNMMGLIPDGVDPVFLFQFMKSIDLGLLVQTGALPSLNQGIVGSILIPHFSPLEQEKIGRVLTKVDDLIDNTHSLIAKYNAIKQGMMQDLFTRGVDSCGKLRPPYLEAPNLYKESELGKVPKDWRISNIGEFLQRIEQGWSPDCSNDRAEHNQWGVLKTTAVVWDGYNYLEHKVLPNQLHPRPEYEVKVGDILMTRGGPNSRVGVVAYVYNTKQKLMLSDKIYRLVPKSSINPEFLYLALASSHTQMHLSTMKTGLAESQTNISQKIVRRLLIPIPIPVEQQRVVSYSYRLNQLLLQEMQYLEKLKILKLGLMQDLLTGKVRVNVDESTESERDVGVRQS